jgi:tetratricopeptide (TPR) repeat protein
MLLALSYKNIDRIEDAIECNSKALKYYKLTENKLMEHRCYINMSILFRVCGDQYNSLNYINDAIIYFQSIGDEVRLINARVEKVICMYVFNNDNDAIVEAVDNIMGQPNCSDYSKGELFSILASLKLKGKDYAGSLHLYKEAEKILFDYNDTEMNTLIYRGLSKIYDYLNDSQNSSLYNAKLEKLLKDRPYYKKYLNDNTLFNI